MAKSKAKITENTEQVDENTPAADSLKPDSSRTAGGPTSFAASRSQAYAQALAVMGGMHDDDLNNFVATMAQVGNEKGGSTSADANRATLNTHPSAAVKEDLQKLFGEEHTPEFIEKTTNIFEAAIEARLIIERQELVEEFEAKLVEAYDELSDELTDKVDQYLDYAVGTWKADNEIAIVSGVKQDVTEQFIEGLKNLFAENYIDIPEDRVDVVAELSQQVEQLQNKLDSMINESIAAKAAKFDAEKAAQLAAISEGLTDTQKEKLKTLSEQVEASTLVEFTTKVGLIKEGAFAATSKKGNKTNLVVEEVSVTSEELDEEAAARPVVYDDVMQAYINTVSRTVKNR